MATSRDPYATLGIPRGASRAEAARAHRRLAKEFHPDVHPGPEAAERMRLVNEAWQALANGSWTPPSATPMAGASTWTASPGYRYRQSTHVRRPGREEPAAATFGDRPVVLLFVWVLLTTLFFIGTWLGSLAR